MFVDRFSLFASKALTSLTLLVALSTLSFGQTTYYVKPDGNDQNNGLSWANAKATVQAGINSATSGDSVWVAGGDQEPYLEQIAIPNGVKVYGGFDGDESSLDERNFSANRTTIDADGQSYAVTFTANAGMTTRIENFVIRGATASGIQIIGNSTDQPTPIVAGCIIEQNQATLGGGIYVEYASPTITGNRILNNTASGAGGGIYAIGGEHGSEPVIADNLIEGNVAGGTGGGGGICVINSESSRIVLVTNNTIRDNRSGSSSGGPVAVGKGGGIYASGGTVRITSNLIEENTAVSGSGGGVETQGGSALIRYNRFLDNSASSGGGLTIRNCSPASIRSNAFADNFASIEGGGIYSLQTNPSILNNTFIRNSGATKGGAIKLKLADPATLINNIVAWSETHNGIFVEDDCDNVEIGYTCFHDNGVNIEEQQAGDVTEHHTLQGDPDPLIVCGFHLADGSPCRDAGDNGAFVSGDKDIDGHDRIINDVIDIGADEYVADVDGDGCVDDTDLAMVLTAFGQNCNGCPEDLNCDGVVDDTDLAMVLATFGFGC